MATDFYRGLAIRLNEVIGFTADLINKEQDLNKKNSLRTVLVKLQEARDELKKQGVNTR